MKNVFIVGDPKKDGVPDMMASLCTMLHRQGHVSARLMLERPRVDNLKVAKQGDPDLIIVVGGDGAILGVARALDGKDTDVIGINFGKIGFLASIEKEDALAWLKDITKSEDKWLEDDLLQKEYALDPVERDGKQLFGTGKASYRYALNEAVLRVKEPKVVSIMMEISEKRGTTYVGDGVIVATSTGSSAYALASGGPIMQPNVSDMVVVPTCCNSIANRPLVVSYMDYIGMTVENGGIVLTIDGQEHQECQTGDKILLGTCSDRRLKLRVPSDWNYCDVLASRLKWAGNIKR